jgi:hypothetical protein
VPYVHVVEPGRDEKLDLEPQQLRASVAEQLLGSAVCEDDPALAVGEDDPVRRRLDEDLEPG